MKKRRIAKKVISTVLALCMVFTALPLNAWAAQAQADRAAAEQVALYMLELGLVDEQGELIYDNSFTVEDGTKLANLDELLDWLLDCPDEELDTLITVDATGKTATAEWIITAINIETQMELLTSGLNSLASGAAKTGRTAGTSVVTDKQLASHTLYLKSEVASDQSSDVMKVRVGVSTTDTVDNVFTKNHGEIVIEAGLFCDFLMDGAWNLVTVANAENELYANGWDEFTLADGQEYLEFQLDLASMRSKLKNDATCDISGRPYNYGLWGGAVPMLFQCHITSGARERSSHIQFSIAAEKDRADAVVLLDNSQTSADATKIEAVQSGNKPFYIKLNASDVTEVTVNDTKYYKFSVPELYGKLFDGYHTNIKTGSLQEALTDIYNGLGLSAYPSIQVEGATVVAASGDTSDNVDVDLYYNSTDSGISLKKLNKFDGYSVLTNETKTIQKIAATCNGAANYSDSGSMKTLKDNITSGKQRYAYWKNLQLPTEMSGGTVKPVTEFYIAKDWVTKSDMTTSRDRKPEYFCLWGTLKVKDETKPTVAQNPYSTSGAYYVELLADVSYYPGDLIPITAIFSEPITDSMKLVLEGAGELQSVKAMDNTVYGSVSPESVDTLGNSSDISRQRTFYYEVQPGDTGISVLGVRSEWSNDDVAGNALDELTFDSALKLESDWLMRELMYTDGIEGLTATQDADDPQVAHVKVTLKNDAMYRTLFANYGSEELYLHAVLDYDHSSDLTTAANKYKLTIDAEGGAYVLRCDIPLNDADAGKVRTVEIAYDEIIYGTTSSQDKTVTTLYYGAYAQFTQQAMKAADANSYTVSVSGSWPSGVAGVMYADDGSAPVFTYADNSSSYTYKGKDTLTWTTDGADVIQLVPSADGKTCTVVAQKAGTAHLYLQSDNGGKLDPSTASNQITITVKEGASPSLVVPGNANTLTVRMGEALQVPFYSNLSKYDAYEGDGKITAKLYAGDGTTGTLVETYSLDRSATMLSIPENVLTKISASGTPAYTVELTANAKNADNSRKDLRTVVYIVVNSQPAVVTMTGLEETMFAHTQSKTIVWNIKNFDSVNENDCAFEFVIEKNGEKFYEYKGEVTDSGSYVFTPDTPYVLKDTYVVMLKAKNGTDPTWSIASSTLTVYDANALKLMVGGEASKGTLTMKTEVGGTVTTNAPAVTPYGGETITGLTDANAIAKLRAELTLMETVSVNYQDYSNWSLLYDTFSWKTENLSTGRTGAAQAAEDVQKVVSINYRQSNYYEPIENFSYAYYLPETVFMLCGLQDGTAKVTAEHKYVSGLKAELTVNVDRLKDQLYLFQFTPAATTTLSYVDGKGKTQTVTSNSDGSLALYEPNGIGGELRLSSVSGGEEYRSTVDVRSLRSGEGNGTERELYPLNAIELTRGAAAEFTLLKPDGTPLANAEITLRGGVYRNPELADDRDDAYCADAKFALEYGKPADQDGTQDMKYTTDANGTVTLRMDSSQFKSKLERGEASISDDFRFIFEVQVSGYAPEIVICESGQTYRDAIRTGNNLLTLTAAAQAKPLVVVQTVDYYTGRDIDVREHTGVVGPSPDYSALELSTQLMLWGVEGVTTQDTGYRAEVRTRESGAKLPGQSYRNARDVSYPFSSIPLVENVTVLDQDTFTNLDGTKRIPLELAVYDGNGGLSRTVSLPFGLVDVTSIEPVSTDQSLITLMANLTVFGTPTYSVDEDDSTTSNTGKTLKGAAAELIDSMKALEGYGAKRGLVRTILMPTEDPTIFSAYIWMGYDNTEMADLRYDENGVYKEFSHILQSEDQACGTFFGKYTASDFRAMSDGTYDWTDDKNEALNKLRFGDGSTMQGWMSTEIVYNFDKGKWEIVATGGGFTWGKQIELGGRPKQKFKPFPFNYRIKVRGGIVVSLDMAVRYAEQLGQEWSNEKARAVNDYLTSIRINAYLEGYAGLGIDKGLVATVGVYGNVELNNENRILNRSYLADKDQRKLRGSFVQLDGEIGVSTRFGVGPLTVEWTWFSYKLGDQWRFKKWTDIEDYWENASSGFSTGFLNGGTAAQSLQADHGGETAIAVGTSGVRVQSRDYLTDGDRQWLGGSSVAAASLDSTNRLEKIQTNAYPYSRPLVSDDGSILVYLSDADSTDVQDVEVRSALMGVEPGKLYNDGKPIDDPTGFAGYGDSALDFDGDGEHAGAVWLREAATLDLKAGAEVDASQQLALVNGLEVVASIWDGSNWTTTRLTNNSSQEMSPIIAVNKEGDAIAAWREVQADLGSDEEGVLESMDFSDSRILYKLYDHTTGTWSSKAYTLYNGTSGGVMGMSVEMIDHTAVVAMALDTGVSETEAENGKSGSEIYYAVVDTAADEVEDSTKFIRATTNDYLDEDPQLAAIDGDGTDYFVLGWHSLQTESDVEQNDVALRVLDVNGTPQSILPETLSNMVSTSSFGGQFTFVKGATSLDTLSLLWNDVKAGGENNDVLRAIKFGQYGGSYAASAPIEVAELGENTSLVHVDAYATGADSVYAMLQVTQYDDKNTQSVTVQVLDENGESSTSAQIAVPKEKSLLCSATGTYADAVAVVATNVDYNTLSANAKVPVTFTVENQGLHVINKLTLTVQDGTSGGVKQDFTVELLPGQSKVISLVVTTGEEIANMSYTLTADFAGGVSKTDSGTLYLDYPDVGISGLQVTGEENGVRTFIAKLYNQAAADLYKADGSRRVVLGVYSDPSCTAGMDGKYFEGGTSGKTYEVELTGDALKTIDGDVFAKELTFKIADYLADYNAEQAEKLDEIPEQGIMLFVKAWVEEKSGESWLELPEADTMNNQKNVTFKSLLSRSNNEPTTMSVELTNSGGTSVANVQVRNNSMQARSSGHLLATLVDANGRVLETRNVTDIDLSAEGSLEKTVSFGQTGAKVVLSYGEPVANAGAAVRNITVDGLPLTLNSFIKNEEDGKYYAKLTDVARGTYVLTVTPVDSSAVVTVNGRTAENGITEVTPSGTYEIVVTAGGESRTYVLTLQKRSSSGSAETPVVPETELPFDDVKAGDWYYDYVRYVYEKGLMSGTGANTFEPDSTITRGMIVTILYRLAGSPAVDGVNPFRDVAEGAYYRAAIVWAAGQGIVSGYDKTTFGPEDPITREQLAAILWQFVRMQGVDVSVGEDTNILSYDDGMKVSEYAVAAMQWACGAGLISGTTERTLTPQGQATRAQGAVILKNLCENVLGKTGEA